MHERAGDLATEYHVYADAIKHYQHVLDAEEEITDGDRARVLEKLAYALFFGDDPTDAGPLFDRVLRSYAGDHDKAEKIVELLMQRTRQFFLDCNGAASHQLYARAVQIAEASKSTKLRKWTNVRMAADLIQQSRLREASQFLDAAGEILESDDATLQTTYYIQKAVLAYGRGLKQEAFANFERALRSAKENPDVFQIALAWSAYGFHAASLGEIALSKACYERALLVTQQFRVGWFLPWAYLNYVDILTRAGEYGAARQYLTDALSSDTRTPVIDTMFAKVGIPLALLLRDETLLAKCARSSAVEHAFSSEDPDRLAPVAAAFAHAHYAAGRVREAEVLLHRALAAIYDVPVLEHVWSFPTAVAQFGLLADVPHARTFLESRMKLPANDVEQASLHLFDAYVAQRKGHVQKAHHEARAAAEAFRDLGWHGYVDRANELLPQTMRMPPEARVNQVAFADLVHVLTARERQVAELMLGGLTNPQIAAQLSISKHTVHSHVTSIMNRLGINSRHQLSWMATATGELPITH